VKWERKGLRNDGQIIGQRNYKIMLIKKMTNKTLGLWTIWTLVIALAVYVFGGTESAQDMAGLIIVANWVFVVIASLRLIKS